MNHGRESAASTFFNSLLVVQGPTDADPDAVDEETARALFKKILCETVRDRLTQAELLAIDEAFNERH